MQKISTAWAKILEILNASHYLVFTDLCKSLDSNQSSTDCYVLWIRPGNCISNRMDYLHKFCFHLNYLMRIYINNNLIYCNNVKSTVIWKWMWKWRSRLHWYGSILAPGEGALQFRRRRVSETPKTHFFSTAVTHRPHIFFFTVACALTQIPLFFVFILSLNAPCFLDGIWKKKKKKEKKMCDFTFAIFIGSSLRTPSSTRTRLCCDLHPKILLFGWDLCSHPMTPYIFTLFSHQMPKIMLSLNDPSFFEIVLSPDAPACGSVSLTPVSIW